MPQLSDIPGLVVLVLVGAYLTLAAASYALYSVFFTSYHDHDIERRGDSALLGMRARLVFSWAVQPIWQLVQRLGLPPEALTTLGVLLSVGSGVTASAGQFAAAGWLYLAAGLCDVLDGRLARAQGRASKAGAALDSVLDRY
ncbi:MAG TPA: CDP-alcohol phosphatidyltransferase family protein, partial [Polyangiaceae bacterium]|nr:CDP-alcohol phosphatidyltransferase family protein [Polyangiaceae bacterium]